MNYWTTEKLRNWLCGVIQRYIYSECYNLLISRAWFSSIMHILNLLICWFEAFLSSPPWILKELPLWPEKTVRKHQQFNLSTSHLFVVNTLFLILNVLPWSVVCLECNLYISFLECWIRKLILLSSSNSIVNFISVWVVFVY